VKARPFLFWRAGLFEACIIVTARGFFLPDHRQPPLAHFLREWGKPQARANKMRAARDAGDLPVSTVHVRKGKKHTDNVFRSRRLVTGVPRAMGYGLIPA
jgi:hypothetical protein